MSFTTVTSFWMVEEKPKTGRNREWSMDYGEEFESKQDAIDQVKQFRKEDKSWFFRVGHYRLQRERDK